MPVALDSLPTPEPLTDDLDQVARNLRGYKGLALPALRSLPSVRGWPPSSNRRNERERSNIGVFSAISASIARCDAPNRDALRGLFTFDEPQLGLSARQAAAGEHLGVGVDGMRRGRQRKLLRELADEMFRAEIAWCLDRLDRAADGATAALWYRLVEMERTLVIDPDRPERQTWTARYLLKSLVPQHPIVVTTQRWSGSGTSEPGEVRILSGPQTENDPFAHRLLRVRPLQRAAEPYYAYVFDLGEAVPVGETVELCFQQVLDDVGGTFKPTIGFAAFGMPEIERVCMRASIPGIQIGTAYKLAPIEPPPGISAGTVPQAYSVPTRAVEQLTIRRESDGFLTYEATDDVPDHRYELWWES